MNPCEKYQDLCSAALDDALTQSQQQELEHHLTVCPSCRAYMEDLRAMQQLWKETEVAMPPSLHEKIMQHIQTEVEGTVVQIPQKQRRRPPVFTMLAGAAACVMLAVSGNLTGLFGQLNTVPITPTTELPKETPSVMEETPAPKQEIPPKTQQPPKAQQPQQQAPPKATEQPSVPQEEQEKPVQQELPQQEPQEKPQQEEPQQPPAGEQAPQQQPEVPQVQTADQSDNQVMVASEEPQDSPVMSRATLSATPPALPEALQTMVFARCFTLSGSGELPVVEDMTLLVSEESTSYYSIENNESKLEKVRQELKKAGYELTLDESSGVALQRDAQQVLVIYQK